MAAGVGPIGVGFVRPVVTPGGGVLGPADLPLRQRNKFSRGPVSVVSLASGVPSEPRLALGRGAGIGMPAAPRRRPVPTNGL